MSNKILDAALAYAKQGWNIFPVHAINKNGICTCGNKACGDAGKHPASTGGVKDATNDPEQIRSWFKKGHLNIGLRTGEASNVTVADIDIAGNKKGADTWAKLNSDTGEPQTLTAETGSGGMHVYFNYNSALKTSTNTLGPGVDIRNDGGYVILPPSNHKSGGVYRWILEEPLAHLPAHLTVRAKKRPGRPKKNDPTQRKLTLEEVEVVLQNVDPGDRDTWRHVGIILGREFDRSDKAWEIYNEWADTWGGKKGRNHDEIMHEAFYEISQEDGELSMGTLIHLALEGGWVPKTGQVPIERFVYFAPGNNYVYQPTGTFWPAESVNASATYVNVDGQIVRPTDWLKENKTVTSMTSDPIIEDVISEGVDYRDGEFIENEGACLYNAYRKPTAIPGDPRHAGPYFEHVHRLMPCAGDADQFLDYMAHRVQRPGEKPRFAIMMGGEQGVGKDTAISMASLGIGVWNIANIEASHLDNAFNEHAAKVLVVISEAANTADMSKWTFNERLKVMIAGQPDYLTINPKYGHKYSVRLHCGVIITTNHLTSGIYIPDDDRRYDVIRCATRREMGIDEISERRAYFDRLWQWYEHENGAANIYAALLERDISHFSASTGQRTTDAHQEIVQVNMVNDQWCVDALEQLEQQNIFRADHLWEIVQQQDPDMTRMKFNRSVGHVLKRIGYTRLVNPSVRDGRWRVQSGERKVLVQVYYRPSEIDTIDAMRSVDSLGDSF